MADAIREFEKEHGGGDQTQHRTDERGNPIHEHKGEAAGYGIATGGFGGTTPYEGTLGGGGGKAGAGSGQAAYGAGQGEYRAHVGEKKSPAEHAAKKVPDRL